MYVCLYFHCFMFCFIFTSTVHNLDYYFTSIYWWLCILLFLLTLNLVLRFGCILNMCVYLLASFCPFWLYLLLCIFLFTRQFSSCLVPSRSVYIQYQVTYEFATPLVFSSLSLFCNICFLVTHTLFIVVLLSISFSPPPPPLPPHLFCLFV